MGRASRKPSLPGTGAGGPIVGLIVFVMVAGIVGYETLVRGGAAGPNDGKAKLPSVTQLTGKVSALSGSAPKVTVAEPCSVVVSPSEESSRLRGYNCHVKVTCGETTLYGVEGGGTTRCRLNSGALATARDAEGALEKDDPMLELDLQRRLVVVSDNGKGWYSVAIALSAE